MKGKPAIIILALAVVGLAIGLYVNHRRAEQRKQDDEARIVQLSNDVMRTSSQLAEQQKVNITLETNIAVRTEELHEKIKQSEDLSNKLSMTSSELSKTQNELKETLAKIAEQDAKINELEAEKTALDNTALKLKANIDDLEGKITSTQAKLAKSEGDREFLLAELKRLQAEKAELERQFNDLAVLREQVKKLKEELSIARRLEWIRKGLYGTMLKGAERLQAGFRQQTPEPPPATNTDLNVEIKRTGEATVIPANPPPTPPATPPTQK